MLEVEGFGEGAADTGVPAWAVGRAELPSCDSLLFSVSQWEAKEDSLPPLPTGRDASGSSSEEGPSVSLSS